MADKLIYLILPGRIMKIWLLAIKEDWIGLEADRKWRKGWYFRPTKHGLRLMVPFLKTTNQKSGTTKLRVMRDNSDAH